MVVQGRRPVGQVPRRLLGAIGSRPRSARARHLVGALSAVGVAALAIGLVVVTELPGSSKGATTPSNSSGAATVERRDLVATDTESGTLGYANPQTVYNRMSGTITWLPTVGQVIKPGQTLYKVDDGPVVLFNGTTPAYRDLSSADSDGPDILELNQNLVRLGFDPNHEITVDDAWQAGTTDAVERWQAALGETETGTVTLGQIVFLPGSQLITSVETVLGSTGSSGGAGSGSAASNGSSGSGSSTSGSAAAGSTTPASTTVAKPGPEFVSLTSTTTTPSSTTPASTAPTTSTAAPTTPATPTTPTTTIPTTTTPTTTTTSPSTPSPPSSAKGGTSGTSVLELKALIALLKAEIAELKSSRASAATGGTGSRSGTGAGTAAAARSGGGGSGGTSAAVGAASSAGSAGSASGSGGTAQPILQTTSTQEVVTVQLDATKQSEAVLGEPVSVELPDGSTVNGRITQVSPVAQSSSSSSGAGAGAGGSASAPSATIPVTISLTGHTHLSGLDQAAVSVNFTQESAENVLSVPVTALIATQGGGYAVQEAAAPHRLIPVTPGLFAAGFVQISGPGVYPGLAVTDSQG